MKPALLILAATLCAPGASTAATYVVDTGSDLSLTTCNPAQPDDCSLRGAMQNANAQPGPDRIEFAIPTSDASFQAATGHWRIEVGGTALPPVENPVEIDGYTQPGASPNTHTVDDGSLDTVLAIEIVPGSASGTQQNGLEISPNFQAQGASVFRGLAISRFAQQFQLWGTGAHRVEGCFLGTHIDGTSAAVTTSGGRGYGVVTYGTGAYVIGGTTPAARNLVSGLFGAILLQRDGNGLTVQGNLIGTDRTGTVAIGHTSYPAIYTSARLTNARIGGTQAGARNVISGNPLGAIGLNAAGAGVYAGTRIEANIIGADASGALPLPNGGTPGTPQPAVTVAGNNACDVVIEGNTIAFNRGAGVAVIGCRGVDAGRNRYAYNRGLPLDLAAGSFADGPTPNDPGDADAGSNRLQNAPVLQSLATADAGATTVVTFRIDTAPANAAWPMTVNLAIGPGGQPQQIVASVTLTSAEAQMSKTISLPTTALEGGALSLVATDAEGNTSEIASESIFTDSFDR